jgi:hypothetical protein
MIRISMPNSAPWHEGCTPNPLGILPEGPLAERRSTYLSHRP